MAYPWIPFMFCVTVWVLFDKLDRNIPICVMALLKTFVWKFEILFHVFSIFLCVELKN